MGKILYEISIKKMSELIVITLLSKFDYFLVVEGNRGVGKSTLAVQLMKSVSTTMRKLYSYDSDYLKYFYSRVRLILGISFDEFLSKVTLLKSKNAYLWSPKRCLLYKREEVLSYFAEKWYSSGIADEMINVSFNRDFYNEDQKDLIKLINMNRDHSNFFIACVPSFEALDTQVKQLCKMRIVVERRSVGIAHTPNKFTFTRDRWDSKNNERIERGWYKGKSVVKPKYAQLTTSRCIIKFPPLTKKQQEEYDKIKRDKRNDVWKEQQEKKLKDGKAHNLKPIDIVTEMILKKAVVRENLNAVLLEFGIKPTSGRALIRNRLRDKGLKTKLDELLM